jgi:O-antigen ligase
LPIGFRQNETWRRVGMPLSAFLGLLIVATLLLAGSRAGLLTGAVGALAGSVLYASMAAARNERSRQGDRARSGWSERLRNPLIIPIAAIACIAIVATAFASTPTMKRLLKTNAAEEDRLQLISPLMSLAREMMPLGGGFGSFNNLFRRFEDVETLKTAYLNHAHMDVVQIVVEGGIPAALLFAAFLIWWAKRVSASWRSPASTSITDNLGRIGSITTGIALLASIADYPLRTPLHMAVFVIGCVWLQRAARPKPSKAG